MSNRTRLLLDGVMLAALLIADNPALTGIAVHEWLSVALAGALLVHLVLNWEWCVTTATKFLHRMIASRRINLVIDSALLVSFVAVMMSGLFISKTVLGVFGLHAQAAPVWRLLHTISAQATLWLFAAHVGMHARWIAETTKRLFAAPGRPASRSAMPAPDSI